MQSPCSATGSPGSGPKADLPEQWKRSDTAQIVDAGSGTVLPGIVDAHCHISYGEPRSEEELAMYGSAEWRAILAGYNAGKVLRAGVTSASDPAAVYRVPIAVRDAVDAELIEGPRFAVAGPEITTHQGLGDAFPNWIENPIGNASVLVRNRDEILETVRLQIKDTVDFVKVAGSGDATSYYNPLVGCLVPSRRARAARRRGSPARQEVHDSRPFGGVGHLRRQGGLRLDHARLVHG